MALFLEPHEAEKLNAPDALEVICANIMNGGDLESLAITWGITYAKVRLWMMEDPDRDREYIKAMNARAELRKERVLNEIINLGHLDPVGMMGADGRILPLAKWPASIRKAVTSFKMAKDGRTLQSVTFASKEGALQLEGRALALFTENIKMDGTLTIEQIVVAADKARRAKIIEQKAEPARLASPEGETP